MKKVLILIKKEFICILRDKKITVSLFLPLLIFPLIYSILGSQVEENEASLKKELPIYITGNFSETDYKFLTTHMFPDLKIKNICNTGNQSANELLKSEKVLAVININITDNKYNIELQYNSNFPSSTALAEIITTTCASYNTAQFKTVALKVNPYIKEIVLSKTDITPISQILIFIPMFITMFLFSGISSISVDMFAGEKERGTMEQLMSTQTSRIHILTSKIIATMIFGIFSALVSVSAYILSIKIMATKISSDDIAFSVSSEKFLIFIVTIISLSLLATFIFSIISLSAKSMKEGQVLSGLITLFPGLLSVLVMSSPSNVFTKAELSVPVYNSVLLLKSILSETSSPINIIYTLVINLIFSALLFFICCSMIKNEKYITKRT